MDEIRPFPNRENFIIRLWQRDSDPAAWVGQVQHVGSGETAAVRNLDELTAVVKKLMEESAILNTTETAAAIQTTPL